MDQVKAKARVAQLTQELNEHSWHYYVLSEPVISDKEYDDLLAELVSLEKKYPALLKSNSPSQRVGVKLPSGAKTVTHRAKMYSLDNTYSLEELNDWHARVQKGLPNQKVEYVIELKIDGVSASLIYENGELAVAATRGDGVTGEDVTHSLKTVRTIPLALKASKIKSPKKLEVRGEIYMRNEDFKALNKERKSRGESLFANARNATSGSIKLLDSRITAKRPLNCLIHSFGRLKEGEDFTTQWEFLKHVKAWGFKTDERSRLCKNIEEVARFCREYESRRDTFDYEVDGVVVKVNSLAQQRQLGETLKSPRWAVAYKFAAHQVTTQIHDIVVQVGRTGVLTPVANLEPTECGGVTISRATLHNFEEIERLGVCAGDRVLVERAGDVIPKIIKVVAKAKGKKRTQISAPKKCPACDGKVVKEKIEDVAYRCVNPLCAKQLQKRLIHFASRAALDIEGLGESVVAQLVEKGLVKEFGDIYALSKKDFLGLELFADKKAENLIEAIQKSKTQPLSRLLFAFGIPNVGAKASETLARRFGSIIKLKEATIEDLEAIDEIGTVIAESVVQFFKHPATKKLLTRLESVKVNLTQPKEEGLSDKLAKQSFVFTGELSTMTRTQAAALVKRLGGSVISSVSKNTSFVVTGQAPGSKYKKALELGVKIIDEHKFQELING